MDVERKKEEKKEKKRLKREEAHDVALINDLVPSENGVLPPGVVVNAERIEEKVPDVDPKVEAALQSYLVTIDWPKPGGFNFATSVTNTSVSVLYPKYHKMTDEKKEV